MDRGRTLKIIKETEKYVAHNYKPLPVVLHQEDKGAWVFGYYGKNDLCLDMLSCYSALNFGYSHPRIISALLAQLKKLTIVPRAFYHEKLGEFCRVLAEFCGMDKVLPMNTGAEAVETAIKICRKWGYKVKKIEPSKAEIIVCENNFHGRTTTIVGFSTEDQYRFGFGPFTPGFKIIPFGDIGALEAAIGENTAGFLVEPIQGEGGINVPPDGYLKKAASICREKGILFVLDEIQTGFGRTGYDLAYQYEGEEAKPDVLILGKALGGGLLPVSAVVAKNEVMDVIHPGDHGSTFGGNPLACAVGIEAVKVLQEENLSENSKKIGSYFLNELRNIKNPAIKEVRGRGLMVGVKLFPKANSARVYCEELLKEGILCKDTRENVIRFTPPLIITQEEINWALYCIRRVFSKI